MISKLKILRYLVSENRDLFFSYFLKNPLLFIYKYLKSLFVQDVKERGIHLFNLPSLEELSLILKMNSTKVIVGFSYCQKPLDCFDRFSDKCDPSCSKCLISKFLAHPQIELAIIPTISFLGKRLLEMAKTQKSVFIIMACEFSIDLFKNFSYLFDLQGIAIPLENRVCTNLTSFFLAEKGVKKTVSRLSQEHLCLLLSILDDLSYPDHGKHRRE